MVTIIEFMSAGHQACDNQFALAEQAAYASDWRQAEAEFNAFREHISCHFHREEDLLFPALLTAGGPNGPVNVMKMEHAQMSSLLDKMATLVANKDAKGYSGLSETLLILMQQHNLKEEQILYPIAESLLASDWDALHSRMLAM